MIPVQQTCTICAGLHVHLLSWHALHGAWLQCCLQYNAGMHVRLTLRAGRCLGGVVARASYCEIYNEALYDLVRWSRQQLPVRWDAARGFHVPDLLIKDCASMADMLNVRTLVLGPPLHCDGTCACNAAPSPAQHRAWVPACMLPACPLYIHEHQVCCLCGKGSF